MFCKIPSSQQILLLNEKILPIFEEIIAISRIQINNGIRQELIFNELFPLNFLS